LRKTTTSGEVIDFGIPLPGGTRVKATTLRVQYEAGDIARSAAVIFLRTPDLGDATIDLILAEGHIFNSARGTTSPLSFSEAIYWYGDIPIPIVGNASVRAAVNNETAADFDVSLTVVWE